MNAYSKLKRSETTVTLSGERCRLHLYSNWPLPHRFATIWPRVDRKSGFVVNRYESGEYAESIKTNSYRLARIAAKRFVEGRA